MEGKQKKDSIGTSDVSQKFLYLTKYRTFQQTPKKKKKTGKQKMKDSPPLFCGNTPVVMLHLVNNKLKGVRVNTLRCKLWTCPACAPLNAVAAYFKIKETALLNNLKYFLTLTLDPERIPADYLNPLENRTHKYITYLFNRFTTKVRSIATKSKNPLKYLWVVEFQKNGNAHLHILLNLRLDISFVRTEWTRIGGGRIMKVENVRDIERISSYVSTYISKGLIATKTGTIALYSGEKRYSISHSCKKPIKNVSNLMDYPDLMKKYKSVINHALFNRDATILEK